MIIDDADMVGKWERLAARQSEQVCRASGARWDGRRGVYVVDFLTDSLELDPGGRSVVWAASSLSGHDKGPGKDVALLALEYLANARDVPPSGRWVSPKQLPSGDFFFRGPHEVPVELLVKHFGNSPEEFLKKARAVGGEPVEAEDVPGDAAARFRVFPRIDVMIVLWAADDEFPARATLLFDPTISEHFLVDAVFSLALRLVLTLISS